MSTNKKIVVTAAVGLMTAAVVIVTIIMSPAHWLNGEKVPTEPKAVCEMLANDEIEAATSDSDEPFTEEEYKAFRSWAKDIRDEDLSESFLDLATFLKPGSNIFEEGDISAALAMLQVYRDIENTCEDYDVRLPNIYEADDGEDIGDGWQMNDEVPISQAPDTELWVANWCNIKIGDTYDQVVEKMGEPTSDQRTGEGSPQVGYDYGAYGFTIFFDTDDKVNSFWAGYDALGETDMAKLSCVVDDGYGTLERKDML